ncbi:hypothetical protein ACIOD0_22225 [Kitasatospora albolonga]
MSDQNTTEQLPADTASAATDPRALEEAQSRLDAAQKRIDAMLMREINHQVSERLEVPSDLFDLGKHQLSDLLTEDGDVSAEKVTSAVESLLSDRPSLASRPKSWGDVGAGARGSDDEDDAPDWFAALRG